MPCEARHRLGDVSKAVGCRIPAALLSAICSRALRTSGIGAADCGEHRQVAGAAGPQLESYMATDAARATRLAALLAGRGAIW